MDQGTNKTLDPMATTLYVEMQGLTKITLTRHDPEELRQRGFRPETWLAECVTSEPARYHALGSTANEALERLLKIVEHHTHSIR